MLDAELQAAAAVRAAERGTKEGGLLDIAELGIKGDPDIGHSLGDRMAE